MRVAIVDTYYAPFLHGHYAKRGSPPGDSYARQHADLMARRMGTSDAYSRGLVAAGHQAVEFVNTDPVLHRSWAAEHGVRVIPGTRVPGPAGGVARRLLARRVLERQLDDYAPDVVYVQDVASFSRGQIAAQRRKGRLVAGQIATPPPADAQLAAYDLLVTSFPHFVERFEALGVDGAYLPLAFDERIADALPLGEPPRYDLVFVGGVAHHYHVAGNRVLERVAAELPLDVWGYGAGDLPAGSALAGRHHGEAWGMDMLEVLARSRICLNRHGEVAEGYANNMRLFEATGAGTLLCTEQAPNLSDLFTPGEEVVAYRDQADLVAQVRALLDDEPRRAAMAAAGHARTMRDHTYRRRMAQLAEILQAALDRRGA